MRVSLDKLSAQLRKSLQPLYLVFGEETLLIQEAADAIRGAARAQGYAERQCLTVETGFDWQTLRHLAASSSLFGERRLLELRLGDTKPGEAGSKVLCDYAACPAPDAVFLITASKLDWQTQKGRWFSAVDAAGVTVSAPAVATQQLPQWIERRLRERGIQATADAVAALSERVEGNLLAAAQEVEKLALTASDQVLDAETILAAVGDSARYSIYDFVDAALCAEVARVVRILDGLRAEGIEPVLVNWALHREVRVLSALAFARQHRQAQEPVFAAYKVWEKRKPLLQQTLQRLSFTQCQLLLADCVSADCVIKGAQAGQAWDALLSGGLRLAGLAPLDA